MSLQLMPGNQFIYLTPIACPHCGGKASLMRRTPDPQNLAAEIRTFECEKCGQKTEMRIDDAPSMPDLPAPSLRR